LRWVTTFHNNEFFCKTHLMPNFGFSNMLPKRVD
jgi:hypothetical protein